MQENIILWDTVKIRNFEVYNDKYAYATYTFNVSYSDELAVLFIPRLNLLPKSLDRTWNREYKTWMAEAVGIPTTKEVSTLTFELLADSEDGKFTFTLPEEPPLEITMDEIEKKFGKKVRIVNNKTK